MTGVLFTTLPREVILEILKELEWYSLLNIRQTCNLLNGISKVRAVWISQYHQYLAQRMHLARLEKPLQSYSVAELERWVLVRRSADVGWRRKDMKYSRNRWVSQWHVSSAFLVPGGRWLLVGCVDGSMTTYDLDAATLTGRQLIPRDAQCEPNLVSIDIDSPKQSPNLTFTMAVSPTRRFPSVNIHFWRVTLTDHSTEAHLTAHQLSSIQIHDYGYTRGIAIYKNLLARNHIRGAIPYIQVFDWEKSTSSLHCKTTIFPDMMIDTIRLLSGNRLLAFSNEYMMIYSFVILDGVDVAQPTFVPQITEPLWKLPFAGTQTDRGALSEGLSNDTATCFVVKVKNIHELIIPHNKNEAPHFHLLMEFDSSSCPTCAIGFERAFIQHEDLSIARLNFSREAAGERRNMGSSSCSSVVFGDYPTTYNVAPSRIPQLDEETGRIVQDLRHGFRVIDTAALYMDSDELADDFS